MDVAEFPKTWVVHKSYTVIYRDHKQTENLIKEKWWFIGSVASFNKHDGQKINNLYIKYAKWYHSKWT